VYSLFEYTKTTHFKTDRTNTSTRRNYLNKISLTSKKIFEKRKISLKVFSDRSRKSVRGRRSWAKNNSRSLFDSGKVGFSYF
jgi:hypothetical protein